MSKLTIPPVNSMCGYAVVAFTPVREDEETADFIIDDETYNARAFNVFITIEEAKSFEGFIKKKLTPDHRFLVTHVDTARALFKAFVDLNQGVQS